MFNKKRDINDWYIEHSHSIFNYIYMLTHDYQKAEDLTHETYIKAYKSYEMFQHNSSPKTWLYRIAHNVTVDYFRKSKPLVFFKNLFLASDPTPLPQDIVEMKEEVNEIYMILQRLKSSYREVIILRKIKEFSTKETSEILGWSESKVKSTLSRALVEFEERLIKEGYEYEQKVEFFRSKSGSLE
ncbi:RNA polymerase sigma factor [Anaerobacillus alkaliphilus]|uniref:RNA polymerase sigma factor n=1 Tax=Anaerobacillus alkaliphilus TaxID=1548597 RepID=A0A4Q0VQ87_9BACI|nr:RNA polymerase sigma factor [Anaerobacillus alkaliphilus]RXI98583.1 RNA polymerase sigma factor [Anaerobacillus alkaliphilus]